MNNYKVEGKYETLDGSILINSSSYQVWTNSYLRGRFWIWHEKYKRLTLGALSGLLMQDLDFGKCLSYFTTANSMTLIRHFHQNVTKLIQKNANTQNYQFSNLTFGVAVFFLRESPLKLTQSVFVHKNQALPWAPASITLFPKLIGTFKPRNRDLIGTQLLWNKDPIRTLGSQNRDLKGQFMKSDNWKFSTM